MQLSQGQEGSLPPVLSDVLWLVTHVISQLGSWIALLSMLQLKAACALSACSHQCLLASARRARLCA